MFENWSKNILQKIQNLPLDKDFMQHLRNSLANALVVLFFIGILFAVISSVARSITTGWLHIYTLHIFLLFVFSLITLFRKRIPAIYKALSLIAILLLAGISGYLQFGLAASNILVFVMASFCASLLLSFRNAIMVIILSIVIIVTCTTLLHMGILTVDINIEKQLLSPSTSITKIVAFIMLGSLMFGALTWILSILANLIVSLKSKSIELEESKKEIERIADVKAEFFANMSHEIRTPMNGIIGFVNQLKITDLNPKQQEYIDIIDNSSIHLLGILNDVLVLSKIDAGAMEINLSNVWLKDELDSTIKLFQATADEKSIQLIFDCKRGTEKKLSVDILRLKQVISNLMSNAIKFTPKYGTISLKISHENIQDNTLFSFSVEDSGIGMNEEVCLHIFDPYKQANSNTAQEYGGTGLGLNISQKLVSLMGGKLELESTLGKGSRFFFSLNLNTYDISNDEDSKNDMTKIVCSPLNILVAEDNKTNQMLMNLLLEENNESHNIIYVKNGQEAVEIVKKQKFDIIFMDINMPVMDGVDATEMIRVFERESDVEETCIIALTANAFEEDKKRYLKAGMNDVLSKPINPALLNISLCSVMKNKNLKESQDETR